MKRLKKLSVIIGLILVGLIACAGGSSMAVEETAAAPYEPSYAEDGGAYDLDFEEEARAEIAYESDELIADQSAGESTQSQAQERLIIRNGNIDIIVEDTEEAMDRIAQYAETQGGWVVSRNVYTYDTAPSGNLTVRIPAERFEDAFDFIRENSLEVRNESSSGQDVTEEFVDLESRLTNLEATADRIRGFLDDAETVEEALAVNTELQRLEMDIEIIKGRMKFLSESAAFSTITISITPDELTQPIDIPGWAPQGVARDAIEALIAGLQGLATFVIWLSIYILPMGILILGPLFFLVRWLWRRWRRNRRPSPQAVQPTPTQSE